MAVAHREDGGAAGMLGRRGQREMSRPRWRRVVRRRVVRRRVVEREAGGVPKAGDSSSAGGSIKHPKKTFRTLSLFLEAKINE